MRRTLEAERQQRVSSWAVPSSSLGFRKLPGCRGQIGLGARGPETRIDHERNTRQPQARNVQKWSFLI